MLIELRYQCYIHACSGNYLGNIFLLFCLSFSYFLCEASIRCSCMFGQWFWLSGRCGWLVRSSILLVRTSVFVGSLMWYYIQTSLKFRPDGEPCRVKSHSPWRRTSLSPLFLFCLSTCAFSLWFLCVILMCTCHICNLSPPLVCF
jgi:hypothetical protein